MGVINEKFSKYSILLSEDKIAPHLPETAYLNENTFYKYTNKYYQVYLRPCHDYKMAILVTSLDNHQYRIESGSIVETISGKHDAFQFIEKNLLKEKRFIIQQAVPRAKFDDKYFEIRVYAAKINSKWSVTEKVARVTPDGYSITDEAKEILPIESVYSKESQFSSIYSQLDNITLFAAEKLEEKYPKYKLVMIDFFIDQLEKPWIHEVRYRFSDGKWDWYQVLRGEKELFPYLPDTFPYHEKALLHFIENERKCIIKPNLSQWGIGVAVISQLENQTFEIHSERNKIPIHDWNRLIKDIHDRFISKKSYHIQKKIPLASINNCPFDVRVMVQRKTVHSDWVVTGKITRIAARGFIVTNVAKEVSTLEDAIEASKLNLKNMEYLLWEIDQLCLLVAKQLEKVYPDALMWGMDIGIDKLGKPWFIEANLVPDVSFFRYLEDKTMYNKIREFLKANKRQSGKP